jgi:hypothetical protein
MYDIQQCFICRPSDFSVSEDAGIEPRTVATTALAVTDAVINRLDLIHIRLDLIHTRLGLIHTRLGIIHIG